MSRRTKAAVACAAVGLSQLTACATDSNVDAMVPDHVTLIHRLSGDVSVSVTGNSSGSAGGGSGITYEAYAQAMSDAITKSALFGKVEPTSTRSRYKLIAFIGKADQQMQVPAQTVKMKVSYQLIDSPTGNTLWAQNIESQYTATDGGFLAIIRRQRLANEGAARDNIQQMLTGISTLEICHSPETVAPAAGECSAP